MSDTCKVPNCNGKVKGRGWCRLHYNRWYRHREQDVRLSGPPGRPPVEHLKSAEEEVRETLREINTKLDALIERLSQLQR